MHLPTVVLNKRGFTLVEVVVAVAILMVGLLGLLESINIATANNVRNSMRMEAVRIGDQQLNAARALPFDNITSHPTVRTTTAGLRSINKPFSYQRTVTNLPAGGSPTSKQILITVTWDFKGKTYTHMVNTMVSE